MPNQESSAKGDSRFEKISFDPRFKPVSKSHRKVKVDERFKGALTDPKYCNRSTVDERGRHLGSSGREDLSRYYEVSSEDDDEDDDEEEEEKQAQEDSSDDGEEQADGSDGDKEDKEDDDGSDFWDRARGVVDGESSSEDELVYLRKPTNEIVHDWAEFDADLDRTADKTTRLAICNVDWDRVSALDLLVLLNSFKPQGGSVKSVTIYLSEFGKERLAKEDVHGPLEVIQPSASAAAAVAATAGEESDYSDDSDEDEEAEEDDDVDDNEDVGDADSDDDEEVGDIDNGDDFDDDGSDDDFEKQDGGDGEVDEGEAMEKVRQYQLARLKYYYAVAQCDSEATGSTLYDQCDGLEMELSQTRLDLRFIPEDMTFDEEIKDSAAEVNIVGYEPPVFSTGALQQSKVNLTWDETDAGRLKRTMKKFTADDLNDDHYKAILASSSSSSGDEEDDGDSAHAESSSVAKLSKKRRVTKSSAEPSTDMSTASGDGGSRSKKVRGGDVAPGGKSSYNKYRALMDEIYSKEKADEEAHQEMEFTFGAESDDEASAGSESEEDDSSRQQRSGKKDKKGRNASQGESNITAWEQYLKDKRKKQRQRKKQQSKEADGEDEPEPQTSFDFNDPFFNNEESGKKSKNQKKKKKKGASEEDKRQEAELQLLMAGDEEEDERKHFSIKGIQEKEKMEGKSKATKKERRKRKHNDDGAGAETQSSFQMELNDPRFSAVYDQAKFAIDPTAPQYKKTKAMDDMVVERNRRRREQRQLGEEKEMKRSKQGSSSSGLAVSAMLKSAKAKSKCV